jgi:hypothetical protein
MSKIGRDPSDGLEVREEEVGVRCCREGKEGILLRYVISKKCRMLPVSLGVEGPRPSVAGCS